MTIEEIKAKGFFGERRWLSNFHPCVIHWRGLAYPSVENMYQACKTKEESQRIPFTTCSPKDAKALGKLVDLRPDWETIKLRIMEEAVWLKFSNRELAELLIATGDEELVEHNYWGDTFWGKHFGEGENHLGRLLMEIRTQLKGA